MAERHSMPVEKQNAPSFMAPMPPRDIDRLFEDFMAWSPFRGGWLHDPLSHFHVGIRGPRADLVERNDGFQIELDVPGFRKEDIEIGVTANTLTVHGKMAAEKEDKGKEYYFCERHHGAFTRTFSLPRGIDPDKIAADLHEGVLTINLPKTGEAREEPRRVEVQSH